MINFPIAGLVTLATAGLYLGAKNSTKINKQVEMCLFDKIFVPLEGMFNSFYSNKGIIVDYIKDDSLIINTPFKEIFAIEIEGNSNIANFLDTEAINTIYRTYKNDEKAFIFYTILKQGYYQRQYIFSYHKDMLKVIAAFFGVNLMSGNDIANTIIDLFLQNNFYIQDKHIHRTISLDFENIHHTIESNYLQFKKIARENIYSNLNKTHLYQSYKMLDIKRTDLQKLFTLNFNGAVWYFFDFYYKHIENSIARLINTAKVVGNKQYFMDLEKAYRGDEIDLCVVNATLHLKDYDSSVIGQIANCLKTDFIKKDFYRVESLRKTPLKYRDTEFDFIAPGQYLENFIASVKKKSAKNPDIWGFDKNGGFINYSFTEENENPHFMFIARSGSGKSFQKQKIMAQVINVNYDNAKTDLEFVKLRDYDIGFSSEEFMKFLKSNKENNITIISSEIKDFSYNICNLDINNTETLEADLQFQTDLISLILQSKGERALSVGVSSLFQEVIRKIYDHQEYRDYRIKEIHKEETKKELLELGYNEDDLIRNIKEEKYEYLKKPLLKDVINFCAIQQENRQIKEEDRETYAILAKNLEDIDRLKIFSRFDEGNLSMSDILSMDLNNFKEMDLFVPIFVSIFLKGYFHDRKVNIQRKRDKVKMFKYFYFLEEVRNLFVIEHFTNMLKKIAFEARKYNIHLCLIAQNIDHIPTEIYKNIDTKIFLLTQNKKQEMIDDIKKYLKPTEELIEQLRLTEQYEMCVWYSKGTFNLKFDINEFEEELFNTDPNKSSKK